MREKANRRGPSQPTVNIPTVPGKYGHGPLESLLGAASDAPSSVIEVSLLTPELKLEGPQSVGH